MASGALRKSVAGFGRCFSHQNKAARISSLALTSKSNIVTSSHSRSIASDVRPKLTSSYSHIFDDITLTDLTIGGALEQTVEKFPDRESLVFCNEGIRRTFAQLADEVDRLAAGFLKLGLKKGDRVGIWGPSTLEWVLTQFATGKAGIIMVNVNPAYQTNEMEYALRLVGCKAIVSATTYKTQDYYSMIRQVAPEIETCQPGQLKSKSLPDLSTVIMMGETSYPGTFKFDDVMTMGGPAEKSEIHNMQKKLQFDDPINIQFTSGTTGHPKGATLSHHNIVNNALFIGRRLNFHKESHRILCQVPLYHCYGMVAGTLCTGVHGVASIFPVPGYDPAATARVLKEENCTVIYGTPTMYIDLLSHIENTDYKVPSLTKAVMAGSPCPVEVITKVDQTFDLRLQVAYGSTETSPVVNLMYNNDPVEKRTTTVGTTLGNTECKIVDSSGHVVPVNTPGELLSRGYCVMLKYWGDEAKTTQAIDKSGWYHSGDLATMDEDGFVKVVGRIKDVIIRGGENVYPTEVEDFLHTHPKVDDVQVIGLPDERMGEEVGAWIRLKEGEEATEEEIKAYCKGKISHFKVPKYIKFVNEFPITVTRKVQKFKMREEFAKELGLGS